MARTKTVSQNMALFSSQERSTVDPNPYIYPFLNLTSLDFGWSQNKEDVITYSKLASRDRIALDSPEVPVSFTYNLAVGLNEYLLGLDIFGQESCLKYILDGTSSDKNYYIFISPEGADSVGLSGASSDISIIGIGNGFINSYSIEASVGDFPSVSVSIQGLNIKTYTGGISQQSPAVLPKTGQEIKTQFFTIPEVWDNQQVSDWIGITPYLVEPYVIRPGDITVNLSSAGGLFYDYSNINVQSFRVGFDLNRQPLNKLGSRYSISREIQYPINVNFEVVITTKDIQTGSLASFLCQTGKYDASIDFKYNQCSGDGASAFKLILKNISLEGQQWSTQAGSDPQTLTTTWVGQIGGTGDLNNGLFLSGYSLTN